MNYRRSMILLTVINATLFAFTAFLALGRPTSAADVAPILRGRALEIVDERGRVRASISVEQPVTMNGRDFPETVLLRLTDPQKGPLVKLTASAEGSALGMSDNAKGGIQLFARDRGTQLKLMDSNGREQTLKP